MFNKTIRTILLAVATATASLAGPAIACKWEAVPGSVFEKLSSLRDQAMMADDSPAEKRKAIERAKQLQVEAMRGDALSLLRAGFWTTTMRDIRVIDDNSGPELLEKAAALRPNDAEYQFFAALAYIHNDKARFRQHWTRARELAKPGSATAKNMRIVTELYRELAD